MKKRFFELLRVALILLAVGIAYYIWLKLTDIKIPCIFRELTGLYCPGCGVTRMCVSLIALDVNSAFSYNPAVLCLLPVLLDLWGIWAVRYVYTGKRDLLPLQRVIAIAVAVILIIFGVLRNIPVVAEAIPWIVPT